MWLTTGSTLGPYEILMPIGAGGMGEVWKARDTRLGRIVAIKISQEKFAERFDQEARAVAALNHPHICQLYDVGPNYLVMEFVEGTPLKGRLQLEKAAEYAGQILDALDAAHRKGITHRDLKPDNILVTKEGVKLLDFGLAKQSAPLEETDATRTLTEHSQIAGTLQYMSPEQLQGHPADGRSDLFSFGCVLYEMVTGKRAFCGQSAANVIAAILEREPAPLEEALPLQRVVARALAKDPDHRFQTARDLKAALIWALDQPAPSRPARLLRHWWIGIAIALAIGAAANWAVGHFRARSVGERVLRLHIEPPPGGRFVLAGATVGGLAISPDSKNVAYVASVNANIGLWVRPLNGTAAQLLPGTDGASLPFWSPNSKSIAFASGNKLHRIDLAGGSPVVISSIGIRGGTWGSDGYMLLGTVRSGLVRVSGSGGVPSPVTTLDTSAGELSHRWPQVLPGRHFLYWAMSNQAENNGVYAASLDNPSERVKLLTTDSNAVYASGDEGNGYLLWRRGGALVAQEFNPVTLKLSGEPQQIAEAVSVSFQGQINLAAASGALLLYDPFGAATQFNWFNRTGKQLQSVGEPVENNVNFRLAPDGSHIVVQRVQAGISQLWLLESNRGLASRFTIGPIDTSPIWSPDSQTILFYGSDRVGSLGLFRKATNRFGDQQLVTTTPAAYRVTDWSGDGRWVLESELGPETKLDLWVLPMATGGTQQVDAKPKPYLRTPFNETNGHFSPGANPRFVAYQSDESGRDEVYLAGFPEPRGRIQVSTAGGSYPQWGSGGRELFYVSPDYRMMAVSLRIGTDSVQPSAPRELFALPLPLSFGMSPYEAGSDGQRFLVLTPQGQTSRPLTAVVNWAAAIEKGAATP